MKIVLVSDDKNVADDLAQKLVFLRKDDEIVTTDYENAQKTVKFSGATVILVHEKDPICDTLSLIEEFCKNPNLCIIFVANSKEHVLDVTDIGVDDFVYVDVTDYELVIRIVNNIKHNSIKLVAERNSKILEQLKVLDRNFYTNEYGKQVVENIIDDNLLNKGVFIVLSPSQSAKINFSQENFEFAIKNSLRAEDVAILGRGVNSCVFLPNTDLNGGVSVFNKVKEQLDFDICAGICDIENKSFDEFERDAIKALSDAMATDAEFVFAQEKENTLDEWLSDTDEKSYKLFRQIFNTKLEKVIAPVFYRLQKSYEENLFETEIKQTTSLEQCEFSLKNKNGESALKILYPGFAKIIIYITHAGLDSPENREIQLPLNKITQKELINIVEDFIKEFKETKC